MMPKFADSVVDGSNNVPGRDGGSNERAVGPTPGAAAKKVAKPPPQWDANVEKLAIGSLDNTPLTVVAQYNPKELQIEKAIQWGKPERVPGSRVARDGEQDEAEMTAAPTRSITVELLFDGYEEHKTVQPEIDKLEVMSSVRVPGSKEAALRRAHHCVVTWGTKGTRPFRCVIESLITKITMFAPNGAPLRATCTVKLKEVSVLSKMDEPGATKLDLPTALKKLQSG
jgi:hypothetical protein